MPRNLCVPLVAALRPSALVLLSVVLTSPSVQADSPVVVRVEEDWELTVGEPSVLADAPQVTTAMAPYASTDGTYFLFTLNFRPHPVFSSGGMQVQQWSGEELVASNNSPISGQLNQENETVTWTQSLALEDGQLVFRIQNGVSQSFGSFGGQGYLQLKTATGLPSLVTYNPLVSIQESGIGFAGNRVASLKLKQIRWITDEGQVYSVSAPIDVDTDLDPWD